MEEKKGKHKTGFGRWNPDSLPKLYRSIADQIKEDGVGYTILNHGLNAIGVGMAGLEITKLPEIIMRYIPMVESVQRYTSSWGGNFPVIMQPAVSALERMANSGADCAEMVAAGIATIPVAYGTYKFFDWLGDDYRSNGMVKYAKQAAGISRKVAGTCAGAFLMGLEAITKGVWNWVKPKPKPVEEMKEILEKEEENNSGYNMPGDQLK